MNDAEPEADVMERAEALLPAAPFGFKAGRQEAVALVARALTEYGDQRARAEIERLLATPEADEEWMEYANLRARAAARQARAAAIEEACAILLEEGWIGKSEQRIRDLAEPPTPPHVRE